MMIGQLAILGALAFVQNMAFTWVSRSRNSGDPNYHRRAAWCSNTVWFLTNSLMFSIMTPIINGERGWGWLIPTFFVYGLATAEGSVFMMKRLLKTETGKRKVGAAA